MKDKLITILVTGSNGQLGSELRSLSSNFPYCQFLFVTKEDLNISNRVKLENFFSGHSVDFCINCAAYTAVDKAEAEKELAFFINAEAVGILATVCDKNKTQLIHISTDYVFDGSKTEPFSESDTTNTLNVYGASKLKGEALAMQNCPSAIIIRTSWLYSSYKNNFVKTMLRLMQEKESISVVNDQIGCPTYAADLALAIMRIIKSGKSKENAGIYHFCNQGVISWYDFAVGIKELSASGCKVNPVSTDQYPTASKRPVYTALDTQKIKSVFPVETPHWKDSLQTCLQLLK